MKVAESLSPVKSTEYRSVNELHAVDQLPKLTVVRNQDARKENFQKWSMPKVQGGYIRVKKNDPF
jgi:hypothetical protein